MNELDLYIFSCYKDDKKIGGIKISKLNKIYAREYTDVQLYSLAKNIQIPSCKECGANVSLKKTREFTVYCSMDCQKKVMSRENSIKNESFNKSKAEKIKTSKLDILNEAMEYYIKNKLETISDVSEKFSLPYYTLRKFLLENKVDLSSRSREKFSANINSKFRQINERLDDEEWLKSNIDDKRVTLDIAQELGVSKNYVSVYLRNKGTPYPRIVGSSSYENVIEEFLDSINVIYQRNDRKILNGLELDFYIPSHNVAIEINGSYYHQTENGFKDKYYHAKKTDMCEEKGIRLIHIFDYDLNKRKNQIYEMLKSAFGKNEIIYARKCKIVNVSSADFENFCITNHLQGSVKSSIRYGLTYEGRLVCVMGFIKSRYNKKYDTEITRYCSLAGYNIIGGASRLFSHFRRINPNLTVISYANRQFFDGRMYEKIGMKFERCSPPNYVWVSLVDGHTKSRYQSQKHKLDKNMTENDYMRSHKYIQVHDSGQKVYTYKR